jgi:hypothetical protein
VSSLAPSEVAKSGRLGVIQILPSEVLQDELVLGLAR